MADAAKPAGVPAAGRVAEADEEQGETCGGGGEAGGKDNVIVVQNRRTGAGGWDGYRVSCDLAKNMQRHGRTRLRPSEHVVMVEETNISEQLFRWGRTSQGGLGPAFVHNAHTSRRTSSMPARPIAARAYYEGTQHACRHKMMGSNDDAREDEGGTPTPSKLLNLSCVFR
ncbi:hypothetical protein Esi_0103_0023 [Ectocarpus siliculosus]|uniref:Uncharacterized protein n=1 Tax=Ectocarpus siliculosus TaxID=2880 RepID=D8LCE8_ECTSI|nr:hypothetical protein Esi_0103_0023 [Ectocarpus siliculosus]|eukprot:CBN78184.1 hypothetical protein Esi_0103_0023 [Ectocarpus siliculosus]